LNFRKVNPYVHTKLNFVKLSNFVKLIKETILTYSYSYVVYPYIRSFIWLNN